MQAGYNNMNHKHAAGKRPITNNIADDHCVPRGPWYHHVNVLEERKVKSRTSNTPGKAQMKLNH